MKYLNQFLKFDIERFLNGKQLVTVGVRPWNDFDTKEHLGTCVEVVIYKDTTPYKQKEGENISNRFEKLNLKVSKDIKVPLNKEVRPINAIGSIYGDYRNQLSVKCSDIEIVQ